MASCLVSYRPMGCRVTGFEIAEARSIFANVLCASGQLTVTGQETNVTLKKRNYLFYPTNAGYLDRCERIPWLANTTLNIRYA